MSISWPYSQFVSQFSARKILLFCLSSDPACFLARKVLLFFKICQFLDLILKFFPIFYPKNILFCKISQFLDLILKVFPNFWPKKSFFLPFWKCGTQKQFLGTVVGTHIPLTQSILDLQISYLHENWLEFHQKSNGPIRLSLLCLV